MDSNTNVLYSAAGLPALISTGITLIYLLLKACCYMFHAISHKTKGGWQRPRQVVVNKSTAQIRETKATRKFANKYQEFYRTIWWRTQRPPGSIFVPRRRQDIRLPSCGDAPEHTEKSTFRQKCKKTARRKASKSPRL